MKSELPLTEELDFHYLLGLLAPLHNEEEFAWLPELFSIVGYDALLTLCKYAGGEIIKIPTLGQLAKDIDALKWFYNIYIKKTVTEDQIPEEVRDLVMKITNIYNARNNL